VTSHKVTRAINIESIFELFLFLAGPEGFDKKPLEFRVNTTNEEFFRIKTLCKVIGLSSNIIMNVHLHIAHLDPVRVISMSISLIKCLQIRSVTAACGNHRKNIYKK
jgi:hypothetical protein